MRCAEVRERLVAWADRELSPGETTQVEAHVRSCPTCAERDRLLRRATPRPGRPALPARLDAAFRERLDVDVILAAAARPETPTPATAVIGRFLRREARVPMPAVVAYAALLAAALGFAFSGWWGATSGVTVADAPTVLPSEQFQPASFTPEAPADDPGAAEERDGFR